MLKRNFWNAWNERERINEKSIEFPSRRIRGVVTSNLWNFKISIRWKIFDGGRLVVTQQIRAAMDRKHESFNYFRGNLADRIHCNFRNEVSAADLFSARARKPRPRTTSCNLHVNRRVFPWQPAARTELKKSENSRPISRHIVVLSDDENSWKLDDSSKKLWKWILINWPIVFY